jgi:amino acid transporter
LLSVVLGGLALLNIRGTRLGTHTIVAATAAKLAPLVLFVVVGLFFVQPGATRWPGLPPASALGDTVLILLFAFVGMEVALVPSGEVEDPARAVPRAVFGALGLTTALYLAIQFVAQGVLGASLAGDLDAPLAEASAAFLGNAGRAVILAGGAVSMFGYLSGDMLATPRLLFAFGRDGFIPPVFARVHPRFHTPHVAIATHALIVLALGLWGTFGQLVLLSNVAVLTLYFVCCAAAWQFGRKAVDTGEADTAFRVVGGPAVPLAACAVIAWILAHATRAEFTVELVVLALASGAYALRRWRRR